jgi:hypothetical protein
MTTKKTLAQRIRKLETSAGSKARIMDRLSDAGV